MNASVVAGFSRPLTNKIVNHKAPVINSDSAMLTHNRYFSYFLRLISHKPSNIIRIGGT
jgi:hypothetical protein